MFRMQEQLQELSISNNRTLLPEVKKQAPDSTFNATIDTLAHQVHPTDPSKTVNISSSLNIT